MSRPRSATDCSLCSPRILALVLVGLRSEEAAGAAALADAPQGLSDFLENGQAGHGFASKSTVEVKGGRMHALLRFLALPSSQGLRRAALQAVARSGAGPKTRFVELEGPRLLCTWAFEAGSLGFIVI